MWSDYDAVLGLFGSSRGPDHAFVSDGLDVVNYDHKKTRISRHVHMDRVNLKMKDRDATIDYQVFQQNKMVNEKKKVEGRREKIDHNHEE